MPRGQRDYGMYATTELIASVSDMGELAARLDSIDTYDRRGNVLFLESFDNDIGRWEVATSGAGASVAVSSEHSIRGLCSMKMVAGSTVSRSAKATARMSPVIASRFGFEIAVTLDTNMESWIGQNDFYTGALKISAGFKYVRATNQWSVLTTGGAWLVVPIPAAPYFSPYLFYFSKSVFDISKLAYVREIMANYTYDLSAIPLCVAADATAPHYESWIQLISQGGFNAVSYLDSCIVTYNEP